MLRFQAHVSRDARLAMQAEAYSATAAAAELAAMAADEAFLLKGVLL